MWDLLAISLGVVLFGSVFVFYFLISCSFDNFLGEKKKIRQQSTMNLEDPGGD